MVFVTCVLSITIFVSFFLNLPGTDISKRKDGGITKSVLVKGKGCDRPNDGASCEGIANLVLVVFFSK